MCAHPDLRHWLPCGIRSPEVVGNRGAGTPCIGLNGIGEPVEHEQIIRPVVTGVNAGRAVSQPRCRIAIAVLLSRTQ